MRIASSAMSVLALTILFPIAAKAQLAGKFADDKLTTEFTDAAGGFTGTLSLGGHQYPATATVNGQSVDGSFTAGGSKFPFTATLNGDTLSLSTGAMNYALKRVSPLNPLAAGASPTAPPNPLSGSSTTGPAGYTVEASTDTGKSLMSQKPNASSIKAALETTFPELASYFGNRPQIGKAYEDAHDHKSGGATFSAMHNGQPVKGFISCQVKDTGTTVAVIFDRADAPKSDWDKLTHPTAPAEPAAPADDSAALLGSNTQTFTFADGTGSLTLLDGWKAKGGSVLDPIFLIGPNNENATVGNTFNVQTPDSPLIKMIEQNEATMRRMGGRPLPRQPMLVAEFTDPVQAMTDLTPQTSAMSQKNGGPAFQLDKVISQKEVPPILKGGKAAFVVWDVTRTTNGQTAQLRAEGRIDINLMIPGTWSYRLTAMSIPIDAFDREKPSIEAMLKSMHVNSDVINQRLQERNDQQMAMIKKMGDDSAQQLQRNHDQYMKDSAQRFADGQAAHEQQMEGYQRHNDQFKADQLQKSRNNADFVETIRGTRTIYDTQTGTAGTADLNYSTAVVNQLNQAALDPNRFVEIPLRDELYPVTK